MSRKPTKTKTEARYFEDLSEAEQAEVVAEMVADFERGHAELAAIRAMPLAENEEIPF